MAALVAGCNERLDGAFQEVGGDDIIIFSPSGTCAMTAFGITLSGTYTIDHDRVVLTFPSGTIILGLDGNTLTGGPAGETFVRKSGE